MIFRWYRKQIERLNSELAVERSDNDHLRADIRTHANMVKRRDDQIEELTSQLAEAESQARQSQNQLLNRSNELREAQKQLDKETTERKRLEACLVQWVEKHDEIESKLAEVRRIVACQ